MEVKWYESWLFILPLAFIIIFSVFWITSAWGAPPNEVCKEYPKLAEKLIDCREEKSKTLEDREKEVDEWLNTLCSEEKHGYGQYNPKTQECEVVVGM